jgi:hypothetical protein
MVKYKRKTYSVWMKGKEKETSKNRGYYRTEKKEYLRSCVQTI